MKRTNDIELESFVNVQIVKLAFFPIIAVYKHPKDYPDKYVARLWDIRNNPTRYIVTRDSLEKLRQAIPATLHRLPPSSKDDPVLVEIYF